MSDIRVSFSEESLERMKERAADVTRAVSKGMEKGLLIIHQNIPPPPTPSHKRFPFRSMRQYVFIKSAIATGRIHVPYRRGNTLVRKITTRVDKTGGKVFGAIGTSVPYSTWVISRDKIPGFGGPQSGYHKGTWWTLQKVVDDNMHKVLEAIKNKVMESLL